MRNSGLALVVTLAIVAILVGSFLIIKRSAKEMSPANVNTTTQEQPINISETPEPTNEPTSELNTQLDADLQSLDKDMNGAFEFDSETDPTAGL